VKWRSLRTGRYVSEYYAKRHPAMVERVGTMPEPVEIKVLLTFRSPSLAEGDRLRRALARSARRVAGRSELVESSYSAPVASLDEEGDE
jgi:hypothetical protein